ncbi:GntP family permease [Sungkyunkwania multivorans]|uniref:GntP family permease n=1 Tax=Sungkyunkwania multivorans TaxID=1173618 RepID=A0ABW3CWE1_9FLAO
MIDYQLLAGILLGILLLLFLIIRIKLSAFLALLIASIFVGLFSGLSPAKMMETVQNGMGGILGFVATVVGLGAIFGAILEHSGGAKAIANFLVRRLGTERAPLAMVIAGFVMSIPVFFDVAFIIVVPMIYSLQRTTKRSLLVFAIPLLVGLATTHVFIPPTPGPIAVAEIIGVQLGYVIFIGAMVGIPTALITGLVYAKRITKKEYIAAPDIMIAEEQQHLPSIGLTFSLIGIPILLILLSSFVSTEIIQLPTNIANIVLLVGHPFSALIIANLLAWYLLGIKRGFTRAKLLDISTKSFAPAGTIILLTGAGGVFKQVLVDTGGGEMIAKSLADIGFPLLLFAFLAAALIRVIQGSATVAMITGAGLVAPLIAGTDLSQMELACLVISIASGATIASHVNDSGFWLISQYLGINERQTFRYWTTTTTVLSVTGLIFVSIIYLLI